jgi:hypothetical protein
VSATDRFGGSSQLPISSAVNRSSVEPFNPTDLVSATDGFGESGQFSGSFNINYTLPVSDSALLAFLETAHLTSAEPFNQTGSAPKTVEFAGSAALRVISQFSASSDFNSSLGLVASLGWDWEIRRSQDFAFSQPIQPTATFSITSATDNGSDEFEVSLYFDGSEDFAVMTGIELSDRTTPSAVRERSDAIRDGTVRFGQTVTVRTTRWLWSELAVGSGPDCFSESSKLAEAPTSAVVGPLLPQSSPVVPGGQSGIGTGGIIAISATLLVLLLVTSLVIFIRARRQKTEEISTELEDNGIAPTDMDTFSEGTLDHEFENVLSVDTPGETVDSVLGNDTASLDSDEGESN